MTGSRYVVLKKGKKLKDAGNSAVSSRGVKMHSCRNYQASYLLKSRQRADEQLTDVDYRTKITIELYCDLENPLQASKLYQMGKQISMLVRQNLDEEGECKVLSFLVK